VFNAPPPGFFTANEVLNLLPASIVSQLISEHLDVFYNRVGVVSPTKYLKLLASMPSPTPSTVTESAMQSAINATAFILRGVILEKVATGDAFGAILEKKSVLSPAARANFVQAWTNHSQAGVLVSSSSVVTTQPKGKEPTKDSGHSLRLGQLVGMEWKLGVGIASTHCRNLSTPFVSLLLRVAQPDGTTHHHALELTLQQFQEFSKTFHDIAQQLETAW